MVWKTRMNQISGRQVVQNFCTNYHIPALRQSWNLWFSSQFGPKSLGWVAQKETETIDDRMIILPRTGDRRMNDLVALGTWLRWPMHPDAARPSDGLTALLASALLGGAVWLTKLRIEAT